MSGTPAVELRGIGKRFPGVRITTLTSTFEPELFTPSSVKMEREIDPDEDALRDARARLGNDFRRSAMRRLSPGDAINAGIGMVHQHFMLADNLTVLENIILGSEPGRRGIINDTQARTRIDEIMSAISTDLDLDTPVSELGVGERQR